MDINNIKMPFWFQEEMMRAFQNKDVYLIVQLNKNWNIYLKEVMETWVDKSEE